MQYITSRELSEKWGIGQRRIVRLATEGKIRDAKLCGRSWLFPEDSVKPTDGRKERGRSEEKPDLFRYPIFEYKDISAFKPPLTDEELTIKAVTEAFHACRFEDAAVLLGDLPERAENRYIRITALYCGCMIDIVLCDTGRFLEHYGRMKAELLDDFPHKAEMSEYIHEIDVSIGLESYYSHEFHRKPAYTYHESFLPRLCNLSAVRLSFGNERIAPADLTYCEINCIFLESTENYSDLQALHIYLACAYSMTGRNEECRYHFQRALALAEKYNMFYMIASTQYYYVPEVLEDALRDFSEDFKNRIIKMNRMVFERFLSFTNAIQTSSIYAHLKENDFIYLLFAVQGLTNKEIAGRMHKSIGTIGKHYSELYDLLGVKNKAEMITLYRSLTSASRPVL